MSRRQELQLHNRPRQSLGVRILHTQSSCGRESDREGQLRGWALPWCFRSSEDILNHPPVLQHLPGRQ